MKLFTEKGIYFCIISAIFQFLFPLALDLFVFVFLFKVFTIVNMMFNFFSIKVLLPIKKISASFYIHDVELLIKKGKISIHPLNFQLLTKRPPQLFYWPIYSLNYSQLPNQYFSQSQVKTLTEKAHVTNVTFKYKH